MTKVHTFLFVLILLAFLGLVISTKASAATTCTFTTVGTVMTLDSDCTTDSTVLIPDGFTLDGAGHTITAMDPAGDHFRGAVVANSGASAHVKNLTITASALANVCDAAGDRLRGIMFENASGTIMNNQLIGLNQGASGCQEGNSIEVRSEPFDGTHPNTKIVDIGFNIVKDFQKTGILVNGDVNATVRRNEVFASATQANLAANSIQFGFGSFGVIKNNYVEGNQWTGDLSAAATAILIYQTGGNIEVRDNRIEGNADVGIYVFADNVSIFSNRLRDQDAFPDGPNGDWGIYTDGLNNSVFDNVIKKYVIDVEQV